jgi:hypothetical protein
LVRARIHQLTAAFLKWQPTDSIIVTMSDDNRRLSQSGDYIAAGQRVSGHVAG